MSFYLPIIPWAASLLFYLILQVISANPRSLAYLAPLSAVLMIAAVWRLTEQKFVSAKLWRYMITPLIFTGGVINFYIFLDGPLFRQFFIAGCVILLWAYLEVIYLRFHYRPKYEPYALENITIHLDLAAIFLVASSFFSLSVFLGFSRFNLVLAFGAITVLLAIQLVWASGTTLKTGWHYLAVISLITTELFYAVSLLPTSVYVNGLLVAIGYYSMAGLARNWLLDIREEKVVRRYLLISSVSLILILITAKWF